MKRYLLILGLFFLIMPLYTMEIFIHEPPHNKEREAQLFKEIIEIRKAKSPNERLALERIKNLLEDSTLDLSYDFKPFLSSYHRSGTTLLQIANSCDFKEIVKKLLEKKVFVDDMSLQYFIKKGIRKGEHNNFFKAVKYMSWDYKKEALLKTIEFPYSIGFKTLYKAEIPLTQAHWEEVKSKYLQIEKNLKQAELMQTQAQLVPQAEVRMASIGPLTERCINSYVHNTQEFSYAPIAQKLSSFALKLARQDQENIKAIGRILKNYLSLFTPGISLISKENGIKIICFYEEQMQNIVLPQPALETIAKHYSLQ